MPKLAAKMRTQVEEAQATGGAFEPLKAGKYVAKLKGVEAKNSSAGNPMWVAEFEDLVNTEGQKQPGRQWYNLNLPTTEEAPADYQKGQEKWAQYQALCAGRIKAFFEAFGFTVDSDTDELIGELAVLTVGIRTISSGPRTGEVTNQVNGIEAFTGDAADAASGGAKDETEF